MRLGYIQTVLLSGVIFIVDRLTKCFVYRNLQFEDYVFSSNITFSLSYNTGIAWSLFADIGTYMQMIIVIVTLYFLYHIWMHAQHNIVQRKSIMGEALVMVGGLSNVCDRYLYEGVVDFIKMNAYGYTFPVFNLADVSVCIGIVIILIHELYIDEI
jgi:signal peptidase II